MATAASPARIEIARKARESAWPAGGVRFAWAVVGLYTWLVGGIYLDSWAHNHNVGIESFFTPWHAVLYSGFGAIALFYAINVVRNRLRGYAWQRSVPQGYELALLGVIVFSMGGPADMIWHEIFGIEVNIEAALSPSHLFLGVGAVLIMFGPFRSAWQLTRERKPGWAVMGPALLSLTYTLSIFTLFTQIVHPFVDPWAGRETAGTLVPGSAVVASTGTAHPLPRSINAFFPEALGIAGVIVQTGLLMGFVLLAMRRWTLPFGSITLVFTVITLLLSFMKDQYRFIPVALLAGLVADALYQQMEPSAERRGALRLFSFVVPVVLFVLYFMTLALTEGIGWAVEIWTGATLFAGVTGLLLSFLLAPPEVPEVVQAET